MTSPQPDVLPELVTPLALVNAQATARHVITTRLTTEVAGLIIAFTAWYDARAVAALAQKIASLVRTAQTVTATNENAYLTALLREVTGQPIAPPGILASDAMNGLRRGSDPNRVYERLAETWRYQRSVGKTEQGATKAALDRADAMNSTDIALAARAQDAKTLSVTSLVAGYRRVIHPEVSKGGTCGLCIAASDRKYSVHDLMPIHDRCACTVAPIMRNGTDPGSGLNNLSLDDLYGDAGDTTGAKSLKRTRYQVHDHGELRAVLAPKKPTRPSAAAA